MSLVLLILTGVLMYMPFISSVISLHVAFFGLGLCTAITDTGCQIMTRKLHGAKAGPWLGANTVVFGISGALVPLIGYLTGSIFVQYVILAAVSCLVASFLIILPAPEKYDGLLEVSHKVVVGRVLNFVACLSRFSFDPAFLARRSIRKTRGGGGLGCTERVSSRFRGYIPNERYSVKHHLIHSDKIVVNYAWKVQTGFVGKSNSVALTK